MRVTLFDDMRHENFISMNLYTARIAEALQKYKSSDINLTIFSVEAPGIPDRLRALKLFTGRYFKYPIVMQRARSPVNHITDHSYGFLTYFLPKNGCVVTCHDLAPLLTQPDSSNAMLKKGLWKLALRGTLRAQRIIAVSNFTRDLILEKTDYPPERIRVIYPGLDECYKPLQHDQPQQNWEKDFRKRYQLEESWIIMHIGRESPRKNFQGLLHTFAHLRNKLVKNGINKKINLLQVGGNFSKELLDMAKSLGITENLVNISWIPADELPRVYNAASALLFPSFHEGFGWPPLEAMACGTPVVSSNVSAIPEISGDAALLFNPSDREGMAEGLFRLLMDDNFKNEMIEKGLKRAGCFKWQDISEQIFQVYEEVQEELAPQIYNTTLRPL